MGFIVMFGNSLADYITKLLVGQGCLLRLCGRVDASYIILTIFLLSSRSQVRVEFVVCKLINDKVWYMLSLLLTHCK